MCSWDDAAGTPPFGERRGRTPLKAFHFKACVRAGCYVLIVLSRQESDPAALAAERTVVSAAAAPSIDTTRTVAGGAVARAELERLPLFTRSPLDFVFLLGGVTEEPLSQLYS